MKVSKREVEEEDGGGSGGVGAWMEVVTPVFGPVKS